MAVIISIVQPNLEAGTYEGRTATDEGDGGGEISPGYWVAAESQLIERPLGR